MAKPHGVMHSEKTQILHKDLLKTGLAESQETASPSVIVGLEMAMSQLYDIESSYSEPERLLPVDLGLDQIEDYRE